MQALSGLRKLDVLSRNFEEIFVGTLLVTASIVLFGNVIARYVFNLGVSWAEELVRYEIIWMVFIGSSVAARKGIHIGVDILAKFSPPQFRRFVSAVLNAISFIFCVIFIFLGADLVSQAKMFGQVTPALEVPMWMVQCAIPIGAGLMAIRFLQRLVNSLTGSEDDASVEGLG